MDVIGVTDGHVQESLCEARRAETDRRLETIERDVGETRTGVGKLLRVLLEGNGSPSMSVRLSTIEKDVSGLKQSEAERLSEARSTARQRTQTRLALWIALGGWVVTLIGVFTRLFGK